jgi:glycosyltransferase involved in cell wall biosynthesis
MILLAGRVTPWKGHRVVVEAAAQLMGDGAHSDICFVFAGDAQGSGQFARELAEDIHARGLASHMRLVGHCADMPAAFMAADVALMPSILPEAFGRVAVEAQAMGCPVIVADHGAVPETVLAPPDCVPDKRTGWRCPPADAKALADALRAALHLSPAARTALADRSRAHVEGQFSLALMVKRTLDVYSALLGS